MTTQAPDFGTDTSTFDASGRVSMGFDRPDITSTRVPLESCVRTILTKHGALFYDTTKGVLVTASALFNGVFTDAELRRIEADWKQACEEQVQFVTSALWRITRDADTGKVLSFVGMIGLQGIGVLPVTGTLAGSAADALQFLFPAGAP